MVSRNSITSFLSAVASRHLRAHTRSATIVITINKTPTTVQEVGSEAVKINAQYIIFETKEGISINVCAKLARISNLNKLRAIYS